MPAPRKFSDAQRQALWRLTEGGMTSAEVARAAAEGRTGLARFDISPRTVRDIVAKMGQEAERKLPATVLDLEHGEAMERVPARAAQIVEDELDRLEAKAGKQPLTDKEIDRLPKLATYSVRIAKLLEGRTRQQGRRGPARERTEEDREPGWAIRKLAREEAEAAGEEAQLSSTRTPPEPPDPGQPGSTAAVDPDTEPAIVPSVPPAAATERETSSGEAGTVPDSTSAMEAAWARKSPAERAEVIRKARAALADGSR